jgi:hypothetical protein
MDEAPWRRLAARPKLRNGLLLMQAKLICKGVPNLGEVISTRRILLRDIFKSSKDASAAMSVEDAVVSRCTYMHC